MVGLEVLVNLIFVGADVIRGRVLRQRHRYCYQAYVWSDLGPEGDQEVLRAVEFLNCREFTFFRAVRSVGIWYVGVFVINEFGLVVCD